MQKSYTINGKQYTQAPLVLGQLPPLLAALEGMPIGDISPMGLVATFGGSLPRLMACVLVPDGQHAGGVDHEALAAEFIAADLPTVLGVIEDFLALTDPSLILRRLIVLTRTMTSAINPGDGSERSAPVSLEETPSEDGRSAGPAR